MAALLPLLLAALPLVSTAPLQPITQKRDALPVSTCSDKIKALGWQNQIPNWRDGTPDGEPFCISHWDTGARIVGLASFKEYSDGPLPCFGKGGINRLEVRFSDGNIVPIGGTDTRCPAGSFGLNDDEIFSEVTSFVAGDNPGGQGKMGWAHYPVVPPGQDKSIHWDWLKDEYNPGATQQDYAKVGGGWLIGLVGYQKNDVLQTIVPIFSPGEIDHITRSNVQYDIADLDQITLDNHTLATATYINKDSATAHTFTFTNQKQITTTYTTRWAHSIKGGMEYSIGLTAGWGVPEIAEYEVSVGIKGTWEKTDETGGDQGTTITNLLKWDQSGPIPKGMTVKCQASTATARGSFKVTSDVTIYFKDGSSWTYQSTDSIDGSDMVSTDVTTICSQPSPIEAADYNGPGVQILSASSSSNGQSSSDTSGDQSSEDTSSDQSSSSSSSSSDQTSSDNSSDQTSSDSSSDQTSSDSSSDQTSSDSSSDQTSSDSSSYQTSSDSSSDQTSSDDSSDQTSVATSSDQSSSDSLSGQSSDDNTSDQSSDDTSNDQETDDSDSTDAQSSDATKRSPADDSDSDDATNSQTTDATPGSYGQDSSDVVDDHTGEATAGSDEQDSVDSSDTQDSDVDSSEDQDSEEDVEVVVVVADDDSDDASEDTDADDVNNDSDNNDGSNDSTADDETTSDDNASDEQDSSNDDDSDNQAASDDSASGEQDSSDDNTSDEQNTSSDSTPDDQTSSDKNDTSADQDTASNDLCDAQESSTLASSYGSGDDSTLDSSS